MNRIRWVLAVLVLMSFVTVVGTRTVSAQGATPIAVPTATAEGCDQIAAYVEARQKILDELIAGLSGIFPDVATPVLEHADQLTSSMLAMSPEQTRQLAALYAATADKIEKVETPVIAVFYNQQVVVLYRTSARTFEEAAASDLLTAGQKYGEQLGAIATAITTYGGMATALCPEFAGVIEVDQTQVGM